MGCCNEGWIIISWYFMLPLSVKCVPIILNEEASGAEAHTRPLIMCGFEGERVLEVILSPVKTDYNDLDMLVTT